MPIRWWPLSSRISVKAQALKGRNFGLLQDFIFGFRIPVIWPHVLFKNSYWTKLIFLFRFHFLFLFSTLLKSLCFLMNVYMPRQREVVFVLFLCVSYDEAGRRVDARGALAGGFMRWKFLESSLALDFFFLCSPKSSEHILRKALTENFNKYTVLMIVFEV